MLYAPTGTLRPACVSNGPSVPIWNPRTENSPPTVKRSISGMHSDLPVVSRSEYVNEQPLLVSGKMYPASAFRLMELLRDSLKKCVALKVGFSMWIVPPSGPPENAALIVRREPRMVSNGLSNEL